MLKKPNILFIITDQQSASMMSCMGNPYVNTPGMDWIAQTGLRLDHAYCTNPICVPSRFSLITGLYPSAIGLRPNGSPDLDRELVQQHYRRGMGWMLQQGGYDAVYAGKQHLPMGNAEDAGFRVLDLDERDACADTCVDYLSRKHDKPFAMVASFINPHDICYMAIRDGFKGEGETGFSKILLEKGKTELACLDEALKLPAGMSKDEFFAEVCPPVAENVKPQEGEAEMLQELMDLRPFRRAARENYTEKDWRMHRWAYANLTTLVDRQISRVLDALKQNGYDQDTVIIFTSDHGDMDSAHGFEHKTVHYLESIRIPLLIRPAGGMEGKVDSTHLACNGLDIFATVCDYAGVDEPEDTAGLSLRRLVENGDDAQWRDDLLIEGHISRSVINREWEYTLYDNGGNREQLYDLLNDEGQTRNHANDEANQRILSDMRKRMAQMCPEAELPALV